MNTTDCDLTMDRNAARSMQDQSQSFATAANLPGLLGMATETLGYLNELEGLHSDIHYKLYGPFPMTVGPNAKEKRLESSSLEEMLRTIWQRVGCLTGDARNLLIRMG